MLKSRIYNYGSQGSLSMRILGSFIFIIIIAVCLYLFYQIYKFLFYLSPLFIIVALIINSRIVVNHVRMIGQSFKQNFLAGLLELCLQIIGLPVVSIGLVIKTWAFKKFGQFKEDLKSHSVNTEGTFTQYEDLTETKTEHKADEPHEREKQLKVSHSYDDLFE